MKNTHPRLYGIIETVFISKLRTSELVASIIFAMKLDSITRCYELGEKVYKSLLNTNKKLSEEEKRNKKPMSLVISPKQNLESLINKQKI